MVVLLEDVVEVPDLDAAVQGGGDHQVVPPRHQGHHVQDTLEVGRDHLHQSEESIGVLDQSEVTLHRASVSTVQMYNSFLECKIKIKIVECQRVKKALLHSKLKHWNFSF